MPAGDCRRYPSWTETFCDLINFWRTLLCFSVLGFLLKVWLKSGATGDYDVRPKCSICFIPVVINSVVF